MAIPIKKGGRELFIATLAMISNIHMSRPSNRSHIKALTSATGILFDSSFKSVLTQVTVVY